MPHHLKQPGPTAGAATQAVRETVSEILLDVERDGAAAVRRWSERLDGWSPESFRVSDADVERATELVDDELKRHIAFAQEQIRGFATLQRATLTDLEHETLPGVVLGHRHVPVDNVGSYSPGGRYPMLASSIMTVAVPKVAGVPRVVATAPPAQGRGIHAPQLYAMATSGADEIVCIGGVQALAALAYGIEDLAPVDMLVGAGNAYVAEAKRQLFGVVGIDLLAGPTEVLVIADETADAELVAADLLGQAEHGPTSAAVLVTTSEAFGRAVAEAAGRWLETSWPTVEIAGQAWREQGSIVVCDGRDEALAVANEIASEHVELQTGDDGFYVAGLTNYGSLFVGPQATVAYGDKAIGTNHVLPTERAARYTGGLWVGKFLKTLTHQRLTDEGTRRVGPSAVAICEAERMLGHGLTIQLRLDRLAAAAAAS